MTALFWTHSNNFINWRPIAACAAHPDGPAEVRTWAIDASPPSNHDECVLGPPNGFLPPWNGPPFFAVTPSSRGPCDRATKRRPALFQDPFSRLRRKPRTTATAPRAPQNRRNARLLAAFTKRPKAAATHVGGGRMRVGARRTLGACRWCSAFTNADWVPYLLH